MFSYLSKDRKPIDVQICHLTDFRNAFFQEGRQIAQVISCKSTADTGTGDRQIQNAVSKILRHDIAALVPQKRSDGREDLLCLRQDLKLCPWISALLWRHPFLSQVLLRPAVVPPACAEGHRKTAGRSEQ